MTTPILAILIVIGFFGVLAFLGLKGIPENSATHDVLMILVGALAASFANVLGYYFGSSKGEGEKSQTLAAALDKATPDVK